MGSSSDAVHEVAPLIIVEDIERSVAFYCGGLGFACTERWAPEGKLKWCRLERGGAALMVQQACDEDGPAEGRGRGVYFYFLCADADAARAAFAANGLEPEPAHTAFYGMRQVYMTDPDGYALCFQSAVPPPGP